jgi:hypothetical protein
MIFRAGFYTVEHISNDGYLGIAFSSSPSILNTDLIAISLKYKQETKTVFYRNHSSLGITDLYQNNDFIPLVLTNTQPNKTSTTFVNLLNNSRQSGISINV